MKRILFFLVCLTFFVINSCFDDNFLETMEYENDYYTQQHSVYFKISDTGQTESYTDTYGEDSDYTSLNTGLPDQDFTDNNNGTIKDNISGLVWTKCTMSSDKTIDQDTVNCSGDHEKYDWHNAVDACDKLDYAGRNDWRLPTSHELVSIVHYGKIGVGTPAIDEVYFPGTQYDDCISISPVMSIACFSGLSNSKYWTSTLWSSLGFALAIHFDDGFQNTAPLEKPLFVRCVTGPERQNKTAKN